MLLYYHTFKALSIPLTPILIIFKNSLKSLDNLYLMVYNECYEEENICWEENRVNVLFIQWVGIPKGFHLDILREIPIGGYVDNLPYNTDGFPSYKIPIPSPVAMAKEDPRIIIDTEYMEFRKHRVSQYKKKYPHSIVKEMYAWERTR